MNRIKDYGKLATDITAWIKNYAENNNISSLVVGVSGGIDSAVVSTLCAMTGLPVYCAVIDIHSNPKHIDIAIDHRRWLSTMYTNVYISNRDLSKVYREFIFDMGQSFESELGCANTCARLRMVALYYIATSTNGIVVGTGNKVEDFGIGFFTKYGDGGVDISPIADLYKTEVIELGRHLGISEEILTAAPTDGLFADGRTDEQQIGCTYEELEWAMENEYNIHINRTPEQDKAMNIYIELNKKNQHKMLPIPIFKLNQ